MALIAFASGCASSRPPAVAQAAPFAPRGGQGILYEQLHSALFQAQATIQDLSDASDQAHRLQALSTGEVMAQIRDVGAGLDYNGQELQGKAGGDPPTFEAVSQDPDRYSKFRNDLGHDIKLALHDVREMLPFVADLAVNGPAHLRKDAAKLAKMLEAAADDLLGTLTALGMPDEEPQDQPDTQDTNQPKPPGF